jgi:uncharacterized protein YkwD
MRCSLLAVVLLATIVACTDGIGTPLRQPALRQAPDGDPAADEDGGRDSHEELDAQHCANALAWPESYAAGEDELLEAINAARREGFRCGDGDGDREVDEREPLQPSPALRCSARLHSLDMIERDFVGRSNPDGDGPRDRMRRAGFYPDDWDEAIEAGERSASSALASLLDDYDDCMSLRSRELTHIGVGHYEDRWTVDLARD